MVRTACAAACMVALAGNAVSAMAVDTAAMMSEFNVIVLGSLTASSETEGTVYVGGSLVSNGYGVNPDGLADGTVGGVTGSLIVGGSVAGNPINVGTGNVRIGGANAAIINQNGTGTVETGVSGIPTGDVTAAFQKLSTDLAALSDTPGAQAQTADQNALRIVSGTGGTDGVAVVNTTAAIVATGTFLGVQSSTGTRADVPTIVNVAGTSLTIGANYNQTLSNVLFNFFEATSLTIASGFNFSILAPFAHVISTGGGTNGVIVAGSLVQNNEFRPIDDTRLFDGFPPPSPPLTPVPLPAPALLLLGGVAALGLQKLRRRA